jgi:hypothetical protein
MPISLKGQAKKLGEGGSIESAMEWAVIGSKLSGMGELLFEIDTRQKLLLRENFLESNF